MWKMREVLSCVDLPQLEDSGWQLTDAVNKMLMGMRARHVLVQDLDPDSAAVVDHILETVARPPAEVTQELQSGVVDLWSSRHLVSDTPHILQFLAHCVTRHQHHAHAHTHADAQPSAAAREAAAAAEHSTPSQQQKQQQQHGDTTTTTTGAGAATTGLQFDTQPRDAGKHAYEGGGCETHVAGALSGLGELAEWASLEHFVLPALSEVFGAPLAQAVHVLCTGERRPEEVLRQCGLAGAQNMDTGAPDQRCLRAVEALLARVNAALPLPRSKESLDHVRLELECCLFRLALHAYARSCAVTRGPRHSLTGLRWLYNLTTRMLQGKRVNVRPSDPLYFTEVAPHSGGKLMLWLLGFRSSSPHATPTSSPSLSNLDGKLCVREVDLALMRRASGLLADSMGAVPPLADRKSVV